MDASDPAALKALDQVLANIFKQKKEKESERKENKAATESMNHFVLRVLDLITIFIKEQPTDPKIIVSFCWLELISRTIQRLRTQLKLKLFTPSPSVDLYAPSKKQLTDLKIIKVFVLLPRGRGYFGGGCGTST